MAFPPPIPIKFNLVSRLTLSHFQPPVNPYLTESFTGQSTWNQSSITNIKFKRQTKLISPNTIGPGYFPHLVFWPLKFLLTEWKAFIIIKWYLQPLITSWRRTCLLLAGGFLFLQHLLLKMEIPHSTTCGGSKWEILYTSRFFFIKKTILLDWSDWVDYKLIDCYRKDEIENKKKFPARGIESGSFWWHHSMMRGGVLPNEKSFYVLWK